MTFTGLIWSVIAICAYPAVSSETSENYENGHEFVDLGLPSGTLWSTENLGAGNYNIWGNEIAWGETRRSQWDFKPESYAYFNGYETLGDETVILLENIGDNITTTVYDAARQIWGGRWQLPESSSISELIECCEFEWSLSDPAMAGVTVTGPNGNSMFIPLFPDGLRTTEDYDVPEEINFETHYWTGNSLAESGPHPSPYAYTMAIDENSINISENYPKYKRGFIRPILIPENSGIQATFSETSVTVEVRGRVISVNGPAESYDVDIINTCGTTVFSDKVFNGNNCISGVQSGVYVLRLSASGCLPSIMKIVIK